jgi:hypothetical protein
MSIARDIADDINVGNVGLPIKDSNNAEVLGEDINGVVTLTADEANVGSNALVVDSSGNVGVGTSSPSSSLNINNGFIQVDINGTQSIRVGSTDSIVGGTDNEAVFQSNTGKGMRFLSGGTERMRIDSSGRFIVGSNTVVTTNVAGVMLSKVGTQGRIEIGSTSTAAQDLAYFFNPNGIVGYIQTSGSSTSYVTSSDYRLKENITEITDGISRVKQLNPSRFNFIADPDKTVDGFIAHEVQDIVPEAVSGEKDAVDLDGNPKYQGVDYGRITPLLTAALKEAIEKIEMLEARIAVLEAK